MVINKVTKTNNLFFNGKLYLLSVSKNGDINNNIMNNTYTPELTVKSPQFKYLPAKELI